METSSSPSSSPSTPSMITSRPFDIEEVGVIVATSRPKKRAGRRVFKKTRHPIFRGVRRRNGDKWVCELRVPNNNKTRMWLGTYPTPEMAARAHNVAALALRGKSTWLNFADSIWRLPVPSSLDAKEIRKAASMAAEMFRPHHEDQEEVDSSSFCSNSDDSKSGFDDDDKEIIRGGIIDEEELFDMPMLLVEMAQGLLVSPPNYYDYGFVNHYKVNGSSTNDCSDSVDCDLPLWSY